MLGFLPNESSAVEATVSFDASTVVTIGTASSYAWVQPKGNQTRVVALNVRQGALGPIALTLDLTTSAPPKGKP